MSREVEIQKLMSALDISFDEAVELLDFDKGNVENEEVENLTEKSKTVEAPVKRGRKPRQKGEGVAGVTTQTRKKKENPTKRAIIECLEKSISMLENVEEIRVDNPEKTIFVKIGEDLYEIDLKMKRKPKI